MRLTTLVLPVSPMFSRFLGCLRVLCDSNKTGGKGRFTAQNLDLGEGGP
jgi:hypothetical protein